LKKIRAEIEAVSHKFPNEIMVGINDRDPKYHDLYRLNIKTGEKTLVEKNTEFTGYIIDDDYYVRFATKFAPDGGSLVLQPDGKVEPDFKYLKTVADGDFSVASRSLDDKQWIVAYMMDNGPVKYYLYDRMAKGGQKARFLFTNRKDLEGLPLQKMHGVVIGT